MVGTSELCCVVKSNISDDVVLKGEPNEWATLRWTDEFGNSIAPFFTSLESGQPFLKEMNGWQLKRYPVSFVVECILADIKQETSFYTIDPVSTEKFKALSPVQFLTELICRKHPVGIETQGLVLEHPDIVPIEALFGEGRDPNAEVDYRRLLADADLIFGVDVMSGKQFDRVWKIVARRTRPYRAKQHTGSRECRTRPGDDGDREAGHTGARHQRTSRLLRGRRQIAGIKNRRAQVREIGAATVWRDGRISRREVSSDRRVSISRRSTANAHMLAPGQ